MNKTFEKPKRTFWNTITKIIPWGYKGTIHWDYDTKGTRVRVLNPDEALLVGSMCEDGKHAPVLDIDFPAKLIPSTTEGHFHLYLDKKMSWWKYRIMLYVLYRVGIIEKGFYRVAMNNKQTFVLRPGIDKNTVKAV